MRAPLAAARQGSSRARSPTWFSTPGVFWYHSLSGLTSTARILVWPRCCRTRTRWPPMKPPAPVTTTRSFLDIHEPFTRREGFYPIFQRLARQGLTCLWIRQARRGARLRASRFFVKSPNDAAIIRRLWRQTADGVGGNRWAVPKNSLIPVTSDSLGLPSRVV